MRKFYFYPDTSKYLDNVIEEFDDGVIIFDDPERVEFIFDLEQQSKLLLIELRCTLCGKDCTSEYDGNLSDLLPGNDSINPGDYYLCDDCQKGQG